MRPLIRRELLGLTLVVLGEALIALAKPSVTNFYFPVVWSGYILTLDGFLERTGRPSLWGSHRRVLVLMIPVSAAFWWLFEAFNAAVGSWRYVGGGAFDGASYVALASVCFATVIPAVWVTALLVRSMFNVERSKEASGSAPERGPGDLLATLGAGSRAYSSSFVAAGSRQSPGASKVTARGWHQKAEHEQRATSNEKRETRLVVLLSFAFGLACIVLPIVFPRYAFSLIWGSLFFLVDPVNYWLGRSSLIRQVMERDFSTALAFAAAAPICGFFWEAWNYWTTLKWVYNVPYVSQLHLFEMPLPGYLGYLPFGLEVYAATVFALPILMALSASPPVAAIRAKLAVSTI